MDASKGFEVPPWARQSCDRALCVARRSWAQLRVYRSMKPQAPSTRVVMKVWLGRQLTTLSP